MPDAKTKMRSAYLKYTELRGQVQEQSKNRIAALTDRIKEIGRRRYRIWRETLAELRKEVDLTKSRPTSVKSASVDRDIKASDLLPKKEAATRAEQIKQQRQRVKDQLVEKRQDRDHSRDSR